MPSVYATIRCFYFKVPRNEEYRDLCSPILSYENGAEMMRSFIRSYPEFQTENEKEYAFRFEEVQDNLDQDDTLPYYYIFGKVHTGQYGREGVVIDIKTGKEKFKVEKTHAEVLPFGFAILIKKQPRHNNCAVHKGLVVFEVNRGNSARAQFFAHLKTFLNGEKEKYNKEHRDEPQLFILKDSTVADSEAMRAIWKRSNLEVIQLIKNQISFDSVDSGSDFVEAKEKREYCRPVLRKETLLRLEERFIGGGVFQLQTKDNFDYDEMRITLEDKFTQRSKVYKLGGLDKVQIAESMPEQFIGADGHPIDSKALDFYCETGMSYMDRMALEIK